MRSLMREMKRRYGVDFELRGVDTIAYSFPSELASEQLRTALLQLRDVRSGALALLRQGVQWASLP